MRGSLLAADRVQPLTSSGVGRHFSTAEDCLSLLISIGRSRPSEIHFDGVRSAPPHRAQIREAGSPRSKESP